MEKFQLVDYNTAIQLNSFYGEAYYFRGLSKLELNQNDGASGDFSKARELNYTSDDDY